MQHKRWKAAFFGTPGFAVPSLEALHRIADVRLVVTQPDRPQGRGQKVAAPPVKVRAQELNLAVQQPTKIRTLEFCAALEALELDVIVVVAYGRILPSSVLNTPKHGCVNAHASLLPRWRGAAPIVWAIAHGDAETGVCLMRMDEGLDTGPVFSAARMPIPVDVDAHMLGLELSSLGAQLLERDLPRYLAGELTPQAQDSSLATTARLLVKEDGAMVWRRSAKEVHDHIRAMHPWPGAYTFLKNKRIKIHQSLVLTKEGVLQQPGTIVRITTSNLEVACQSGTIGISEVQLEGARRMNIAEFVAGHPLEPGAQFAAEERP